MKSSGKQAWTASEAKLDARVCEIFDEFGIPCFGIQGNVDLKVLYPASSSTAVIELDLIARMGKVGILIETTTQAHNNVAKIKDFEPKCRLYVNAEVDNQLKFLKKKAIPASERARFRKVKEWRYLYFGTSDDLITKKVKVEDAGIRDTNFFLFNRNHIQYLAILAEKIGRYGKYEFLDHLNIPIEETDPDIKDLNKDPPTIKLEDKKIRKGKSVDLYAFKLNVHRLLMVSKVIRYGSLGSVIPELGRDAYQRLLVEKKLGDMRKFIKKEKGSVAFPNAITAILSSDVEETGNDKIKIPTKYGALEVVDGQHRLFSFANAGLSEEAMKEIELFVIGVKFEGISQEKLHQWAATTFVDINRNQTKVRTDLIYLISYSAMGERNPKSISARVLLELNIRDQPSGQNASVLRGVFFSNPFEHRTPGGAKRVRIVTIINILSELFDNKNPKLANKLPEFDGLWKKYDKLVAAGADLLDSYFAKVSKVFADDWASRRSLIFSTNYIAAFSALFIHLKEKALGDSDIYRALDNIKSRIKVELADAKESQGPNGELLNYGSKVVPDVKHVSEITDFLVNRI